MSEELVANVTPNMSGDSVSAPSDHLQDSVAWNAGQDDVEPGDDWPDDSPEFPAHPEVPDESGGPAIQPRVLIVEDDRGLRLALRRAFQSSGYHVEMAGDAYIALDRIGEVHPHVVILDLMLPRGSGIELCRRIRRRPGGQDLAIIILTARDSVADRLEGFQAGADDFVIKPCSIEEVLARVKAHLRHVWSPRPQVLRFADVQLDSGRRVALRSDREIDLSTTEYHLLELFLRHPQQVLSRQTIGEQLWGLEFEAESNVIEVYVRRLRRKLEVEGEAPLIHTVRGSGYVLRERAPSLGVP